MKKSKFLAFILIVSILSSNIVSTSALAVSDPAPSSNEVILVDAASGNTVYAKNENNKAYPASLTKVMTVMLAVEAIENGKVALTDNVTAGKDINADLSDDGSTSGIVPGETMTLENLLYCAMLSSANEACNIIAEYIGGDLQTFIGMMNSRAAELGCTGTHFVNAHGLPDENHYTTAGDFAKISLAAISHPLFAKICNTVTRTVPATNVSKERVLQNTNGLINTNSELYPGYLYQYAAGVKTGHTTDAGYCLVSTASKDGVELLCVVLGGKAVDNSGKAQYTNFLDSISLYNWAFANFSYRDILETTDLVKDIPVKMGKNADFVTVHPETAVKALLPNDEDASNFEQKITIYSEDKGTDLVAPVQAGTALGEISIERDGVVYGTSKLVACTSIDLSYSQFIKSKIANSLKQPLVIIFILLVIAFFAAYIYLVVRYHRRKRKYQRNLSMRNRAEQRAVVEQARKAPQEKAPQRKASHVRPADEPKRLSESKKREPGENPFSKEVLDREAEERAERDYFEEFFGRNK
jgi:serine-type D-Ala-D-Ala carboxypeptidase (penicillin-binding protein 5/6)